MNTKEFIEIAKLSGELAEEIEGISPNLRELGNAVKPLITDLIMEFVDMQAHAFHRYIDEHDLTREEALILCKSQKVSFEESLKKSKG